MIAILVFGFLLRIWNITGPDIIGDDALNSFRAVGYYDWIASLNTQTTPVTWFENPVWWQKLSFHDGPPLVFAVQWIFFQIFGVNLFVARLPFVLSGVLAIYAVYLLSKEMFGERAGLIASAVLAVMNYHVWISRIGYLDGFLGAWIAFALYFFLKAKRDPRYYFAWGAFLGLAFITKYTSFFMMPLFFLLLLMRRHVFKEKFMYGGILCILICAMPVIIYNLMMWQTRGHLDAALSTMIGDHPADFQGLTREVNTKAFDVAGVLASIFSNMSIGFSSSIAAAFIALAVFLKNLKKPEAYVIIGLGITLTLLTLVFAGGSDHFGVITLPFLALALGGASVLLFDRLRRLPRIVFTAIGAMVLFWEVIFTAQSQLMPEPVFPHRLLYDATRPVWFGYNEFERYVRDFYLSHPEPSYIVMAQTPQIREYKTRRASEFAKEPGALPQQTHLLVYDDRMDWTAAVWTIERRRLYDVAMVPSLTNFADAIGGGYLYKFEEFGFKDITLILATDTLPKNQAADLPRLQLFSEKVASLYKPVDSIKNLKGEVIFNVYQLPIGENSKLLSS